MFDILVSELNGNEYTQSTSYNENNAVNLFSSDINTFWQSSDDGSGNGYYDKVVGVIKDTDNIYKTTTNGVKSS